MEFQPEIFMPHAKSPGHPADGVSGVSGADGADAATGGCSPEAATATACGVGGAPPGRGPLAAARVHDGVRTGVRFRNGVAYVPEDRSRGALVANSRTSEGYKLPVGKWLTCLVDATYNGIMTLAPSLKPSLQKMRSKATPELGNVRQATWRSMNAALGALEYPTKLVEATARFQTSPGGPMLSLVTAPHAVLIVGLHVRIDGEASEHCIMLSTLPEPHAPFGKMIDNHGEMKPVYIVANDRASKPAAARAFRTLVMQNPATKGCRTCCVDVSDVYQLVWPGAPIAVTPVQSATPMRPCSGCECPLPASAFSKTQLGKGTKRRCTECVRLADASACKRPCFP